MRRVYVLILLCCSVIITYSQVNINAPWTWVSGEKHIPMRPVPGTKNVSAPENNPGGRRDAVSWTDQAGTIWMFGGFGYSGNGIIAEGYLNDLWKFDQATKQWTWVNGSLNANELGKYGTKGVASDDNIPGGRYSGVGWVGSDNNLYLFGGAGRFASGYGMFNDLWKYDVVTNQWTWVNGPNTTGSLGIYGSKTIANASNWPGARSGSTYWQSNDNIVWLFGGDGYAATGASGRLNDMWKFDPSTNQWTWMNGTDVRNTLTTSTSPGGRNTGNTSWKDNAGNLYLWGGVSGSSNPPCGGCSSYTGHGDFWKYNTATNVWTNLTPSFSGMFSPPYPGGGFHSLAWNDNSGNLWLFGGYGSIIQSPQNMIYERAHLNNLWKFNLFSGLWTRVSGDRYYTELYGIYGIQGIPHTANRRGGRASAITWVDGSGKLWSFGGEFQEAYPLTYRNDLWVYDPLTNLSTWMQGDSFSTVKPIYGTLGVASTNNRPGERRGTQTWSDKNGNLWLYGGNIKAIMDNPMQPCLNDFWKYNINSGLWTVVRNQGGLVYGVKGVPSPNNRPGGKENATYWSDASGNLWLFGGFDGNYCNSDLWKYDTFSDQWTWMSGDKAGSYSLNYNAVYGTQGVADALNKPGMRQGAPGWTDNNNNLWLFGGSGPNISSTTINDLWKYNTVTNQWTWMNGDNIPGKPGVYGVMGVEAAGNKPGARTNSAAWKDNTGNLWLFAGSIGSSYFNDLWKYDIASNHWMWIHGDSTKNNSGMYGVRGTTSAGNKPGARNRPVSWSDDNGNFWLMGGLGYDATGVLGNLNDLWMYSPLTNQWTWVKGDETINNTGLYGTKGIGSSLNKPGSRYGAAACRDEDGNVWLYGGFGFGESGQDRLSDLWKLSSDISGTLALFLEFKGRLVNDDGVLNWKTRNEGNVAAFVIERSTDRRYFYPVGTISANNSTGIQQYDFTDAGITSLGANIVYYRLKQTDRNGNVKYSNIVALTIDKSFFVFLYPNPVITTANITITIDNPRILQARIINAAGATVKQYQWNLTAGSTTLSLDLAILASGTYYLDLSGENISKRIPFIKK